MHAVKGYITQQGEQTDKEEDDLNDHTSLYEPGKFINLQGGTVGYCFFHSTLSMCGIFQAWGLVMDILQLWLSGEIKVPASSPAHDVAEPSLVLCDASVSEYYMECE